MALHRSLVAWAIWSSVAALHQESVAQARATAWLKNLNGNPSFDDLSELKGQDPDSYALVQNLLSSGSVVFSLEHSEARAMDAPVEQQSSATSQAFAGVQVDGAAMPVVPGQHREGLVQLPAFARTVETAAGIAEDSSKLSHDFGDAAAAPTMHTFTALNQASDEQSAPKGNPLLEAAAKYTQEDVAVSIPGAEAVHSKTATIHSNPYGSFLS